ncbi:MAG: DNA translocase FtsK [Prevotella sp.]|nr:DNA translocase FtsK [Prevotella sp.]
MAKKRKKSGQGAKSLGEAVGLTNIFNNEKIDFVLGVVIFAATVFVTVAMVSFFFTGYADQSILCDTHPGEWLNSNHEYANSCGSFGAITAWTLMAVNFGLAAFVIPFFLLLVALQLMGAYRVNLWKWFLGLAVLMIWYSVTLAKFLTPYAGGMLFNPGGEHGVAVVRFVENLVGETGLTALIVIVAIVFLTVLSTKTITWIRKILRLGVDNKIKIPWSVNVTKEEEQVVENEDVTDEEGDEETEDENLDVAISDEFDLPDDAGGDLDENSGENASENASGEGETGGLNEPNLTIEVPENEAEAKGKVVGETVDLSVPINPREPFLRYKFPTLDLLNEYESDKPHIDMDEVKSNNARIIEVLNSFGVKIKEIKATIGPTITLYEVTPAEGVKISRIRSLEDDIALCLSALGVRIIAPIPGKGTVGIEVPNKKPQTVSMRSLLNSKKFQETSMELPLAIGKTITNEVFMVDLAKIPHLLVAGATGQGKSVGLNAMITSLLYKKHPNELKIILVDPKKVEFSPYAAISSHFMAAIEENVTEPIITDVTKVVKTLNSLCLLMDTRYDLLKQAGAKNIKEYNEKYVNHKLRLTAGHAYMPYIVVIIDEFGDLIMTAGKEVELPIARIAQLARAVGIHMVIATQRPTTTIITGNIKANFPGRMAFRVGAMIDSRTILDRPGANQLVGRGDLLFLNGGEPVRVQCAFVDSPEVERITEYISRQPGPIEPLILPEPASSDGNLPGGDDLGGLDPYFEEAARAIVLSQQGSTSMIQRKFSIGYNRAGRLMDQMERAGIVGPSYGGKPRDVLIADENTLNTLLAKFRLQ